MTKVKRVRRKRRHSQHHRSRFQQLFSGRMPIYLGAAVFGLLLGFSVLSYGPRTYRNWRESRILESAKASLAKDDLAGAVGAAQEILQIDPNSLGAFHILADATE